MTLSIKRCAYSILATLAIVGAASAADACQPSRSWGSPELVANRRVDPGQRQSSYLRVYELHDRTIVWGKHSNGHRTSGETFRTLVLFLDDRGKVIHSIGKLHGVNATFGGATKTKCWRETITNREIRANTKRYVVVHDTCDTARADYARQALIALAASIDEGAGKAAAQIINEHNKNC